MAETKPSGFYAIIMDAFNRKDALGGAWCYPDQVPHKPHPGPFIVYHRIGGKLALFSELAAPDKRNARIQLEVWTKHPAEREQIVDAMVRIIAEHPQMEQLSEAADDYDRNVELYGSVFDVSVWWTRSTP